MTGHPLIWIGFSLLVLAVLALDLGVFHRKAHAVGFKEALSWTGVWVTLAVLFGAGVWHWAGPQKGLEFFTGYLIEYSLSADNVFVFVLIFSYFAVPARWQHKVLFWGVLGALVMRLVMIGLGVALISRFGWILYVFGAFLLFTGFKMVFGKQEEIHPERNPVVRWFRKLVPVTAGYHGDRFVARVNRRRMATPLAGRARVRRSERPRVRGGFHPGHLRGHAGPVHRLYLERVRHPGAALALLRSGGDGGQVPLPQDWVWAWCWRLWE